jgi:hypothetical protein
MEGKIIIEPHIGTNPDGTPYHTGSFDITHGDKMCIGATFEETLGLLAAVLMPEARPCLQWLKTEEQERAWQAELAGISERNKTREIMPVDFDDDDPGTNYVQDPPPPPPPDDQDF